MVIIPILFRNAAKFYQVCYQLAYQTIIVLVYKITFSFEYRLLPNPLSFSQFVFKADFKNLIKQQKNY